MKLPTKSYDQMDAVERYDMWRHYKNACSLCVTYAGRHDYQLGRKYNSQADQLYFGWIRYFTAEDIVEPQRGFGQ